MAQFFFDPNDWAVGDGPGTPGFPFFVIQQPGGDAPNVEIRNDGATNYLYVATISAARQAVGYSPAGSVLDAEIYVNQSNASGASAQRIGLRARTDTGAISGAGIWYQCRPSSIDSVVSDTLTALASASSWSENVRFRVSGTSPATVQSRSWGAASEPGTWDSVSDSTAELQQAGHIALAPYSDSVRYYAIGFGTNGDSAPTGPVSDTTAPTVTSASVPTAGDTIVVQMSESMQVGAGGAGGWTISLGDATISSAAVDGTDDTIINLTPSRTLLSGETFTIGYTQPTDGFQDQAATPNDLATLSGQAVTNNSTQTATLSISAADNITSEGQTFTFTLANNAGDPTGATLNGTDVGTLTLVSGSTYSATSPLLADDATADLVVSVDSTTVSTVISYANSYPLVLTNHGTPEPNSVMEGNQFGTTQPVELKVITDTDPAIADIDWSAMSSNQQWLTDIRNASSVTSVADGTTSFTLGYFVQETGETGTFDRNITTTDTLSPAVTSVDVPTAGTYHAGDTLSFTANWNEAVNVTGTPALNLNIGGSARQANYASGTGTAALVFTYTVQAGDVDADGIAVSSLTLDGGTIQDTAGNDAFLTLNSVGDTSGVLVDADGAVIQSVAVPTDGTYVPGNALDFTVTFEAAVTVTGTPELILDIGGEARAAAYVSGSTTTALLFRYTVASGDLDTDGVGVSSFSLAGGTIKDQYSVDANLTLNSVADTSGVLVDGVAPVISINALTTLDTSPIVSGSAGGATSLTLVVTGVGTYTPTPSGGTWSQQLPTLALGDYAMTLNGEDANGNAAIEASATLRVVDEIVTTPRGLFQPLFRSLTGSVNQTLFR